MFDHVAWLRGCELAQWADYSKWNGNTENPGPGTDYLNREDEGGISSEVSM